MRNRWENVVDQFQKLKRLDRFFFSFTLLSTHRYVSLKFKRLSKCLSFLSTKFFLKDYLNLFKRILFKNGAPSFHSNGYRKTDIYLRIK